MNSSDKYLILQYTRAKNEMDFRIKLLSISFSVQPPIERLGGGVKMVTLNVGIN